ncbi:Hypothetical protein NTJ_14380 [Nesidiocoris tenuis]|uniref:Uncharacterized protein n=1 Tax=Nesidiocoris tenuis TaxID=355587 RepID=A0ABN7BB04_9HEMI|nr:Hypothetical protein NTJ_14380 [Nesidiocoris tenuis]
MAARRRGDFLAPGGAESATFCPTASGYSPRRFQSLRLNSRPSSRCRRPRPAALPAFRAQFRYRNSRSRR